MFNILIQSSGEFYKLAEEVDFEDLDEEIDWEDSINLSIEDIESNIKQINKISNYFLIVENKNNQTEIANKTLYNLRQAANIADYLESSLSYFNNIFKKINIITSINSTLIKNKCLEYDKIVAKFSPDKNEENLDIYEELNYIFSKLKKYSITLLTQLNDFEKDFWDILHGDINKIPKIKDILKTISNICNLFDVDISYEPVFEAFEEKILSKYEINDQSEEQQYLQYLKDQDTEPKDILALMRDFRRNKKLGLPNTYE